MLKRAAYLVLVVLVAGAAGAWWEYARATRPYQGFQGEEVFVDLAPGSGVASIARSLADAGVVPDALTFRLVSRRGGLDRRLEAGEYRFAGPATPMEVAQRLARGDVFTRSVTFP